jgi:uncharacterized damage-inducible protein DinB
MNLADCRALLGHAEWADALVWKAVPGGAERDAEVRAKLHHLHLVQWVYLHVWRGETIRPRELESFPTTSAVGAWARGYYEELSPYLAAVAEGDLSREVRFPWVDDLVRRFGQAHPATWAESVLQVAMHSSYHRGQVARRLRELDVEPPMPDYVVWLWMGRPIADWGSDEAA